MEPDERHHHHHHHQEHHLTSPYYHPFHHHTPTTVSAAPSYNGNMLPPPPPNDGSSSSYHHSAPSSAVTAPIEPVKRKRGRPRKYDTPAQALAAKKLASSASSSSARERREQAAAGGVSPPSKPGSKNQFRALSVRITKTLFDFRSRKSGQSFTPHIVNITPGEDVAQKIILFAEQSKHELCILSASGAISDPSLSHLATGTSVSYQGQYEILSLRGSYIRGEHGGKTGGLSVCLSSSDGQIVGGGVGKKKHFVLKTLKKHPRSQDSEVKIMEPNERHHHHHHHQEHHLTSPYYHPFHHHTPTTVSAAPSDNGNFPPPPPNDGSSSSYHRSAPSSAVTAPIEPVKRKRGRPRKYDTPAQALAAKKLASSASSSSARERREQAAAAAGGVSPPSKPGSKKSISGSFGEDYKNPIRFSI
ncbi:hypothetical protein F2Q69_00015256 [Brassica cretica]|uniref:AT-hook motif nuclear-localized protein n=1 Tax=Brassica cretica TaxID=69181 RepID=A0A8S9R756_BRACR|nr:hypothetical protein F2Q69_00015256 [Brassica cretica]